MLFSRYENDDRPPRRRFDGERPSRRFEGEEGSRRFNEGGPPRRFNGRERRYGEGRETVAAVWAVAGEAVAVRAASASLTGTLWRQGRGQARGQRPTGALLRTRSRRLGSATHTLH